MATKNNTPEENQSPTLAQAIQAQTAQQQGIQAEDAATSAEKGTGEKAPAGSKGVNDIQPNGAGEQEKLLKTAPEKPSTQQDIDQILGPYIHQMMQLGPEYQAEMQYLAPYLSGNSPTGLSSAPTYTGPDASTVNSTTQALNTAEQAQANAIENQPTPGFGQAANTIQQYEQSLPYQQAIAAGAGYQKYLETYGGQPTNTQGWPASIQGAYNLIGGGVGSNGLLNPTQAAKNNSAAQNATTISSGGLSQ